MSYRGFNMCPLKSQAGLTFRRFADPKSTLWAPTFPNAEKIGKLGFGVKLYDENIDEIEGLRDVTAAIVGLH